jgi:hypothetical protein
MVAAQSGAGVRKLEGTAGSRVRWRVGGYGDLSAADVVGSGSYAFLQFCGPERVTILGSP